MDIELRQSVVEQERQKIDWLQRCAVDPRFTETTRARAAKYALALQGYVALIVLMTERQSDFEESFHGEAFGEEA